MKKTLLLSCSIFTSMLLYSQSFKPAPKNNSFEDSLNIVVTDYKNNFSGLQGAELQAGIDAETYESKMCLPGATHCIIMRYHSVVDKSASWQATLYSGDNYEEAMKAYKKICDQLKRAKLKGVNGTTSIFEGKLETPDENVRFAVSSFRLKSPDMGYMNFAADVELINNYDGWEVHLNLYKKKKDTEGGNMQ